MLIVSTKQQMSLKRNTLVRDLRNRYNEVELSYVTLIAYNVLFIAVNVKKKFHYISVAKSTSAAVFLSCIHVQTLEI